MDSDTKKEVQLRTLKLNAQEQNKAELDTLELKLTRLYTQEYETINGIKKKITKTRRIALGKSLINEYGSKDNLDINDDVLNTIKAMDK